jgi:hypothetical protein
MRAVAGGAEFGHGGAKRDWLEVEDLDGGTTGGEALRNGESDAGRATGDDGSFVDEAEGGGAHVAWFS